MAASEQATVTQAIVAECVGLLEPIRESFHPTLKALEERHFINHLKHQEWLQTQNAQRKDLSAMLSKVDGKIARLEAEKNQLRQSGKDDPHTVGRIGLVIMDIEALQGAREKYAVELATLPDYALQRDWGLEGWQAQVKEAKVKALFSAIEAAENVIHGALQKLKALNAVSLNYSRTIRAS